MAIDNIPYAQEFRLLFSCCCCCRSLSLPFFISLPFSVFVVEEVEKEVYVDETRMAHAHMNQIIRDFHANDCECDILVPRNHVYFFLNTK